MFNELFSPIRINQVEIKNRISFPAMGILYSLDEKLNDRYYNFYLERAKGGAGIVTVGPVGIGELGAGIVVPSITSDTDIPDFAKLAKSIQTYGAKAWMQLYHGGGYVRPMQIGGQKPMAPSAVYSNYIKDTPRAMSLEDIKNVQKAFINGAIRAKTAGFDGVEIIASAGYLICEFLSPLTNKRSDEYGGSLENRVRFVREIIEQMREKLGSDYPITIRMAGNDFVPGSNTDLETPAFAKIYEKAGVDAISVTGGWHESKVPQLTMDLPRGGFAYLARNIKEVVSVPVMAANRISDPYTAEGIIKDGYADMVNLCRALLADPYWPSKAEKGHTEEIRPCVACLQGCMDELFNIRPVICSLNARTGFEGERSIKKAEHLKQVMVIGGGPGGMEAALRAAEAGHQVELYEKTDRLGGQLWLAGAPPDKQELLSIISYYRKVLPMNGVNVRLNTEVNLDLIKQKKPDYIFAAEGATYLTPQINGIDSPCVVPAWNVLKNETKLGQKIAIIGGGAAGLETAYFLAKNGALTPEELFFLFKYEAESASRLKELVFKGNKEVTIFEMSPSVGKNIGKSTKWVLMGNLNRYGVQIVTGAKVLSVKDGRISYEKSDGVIEQQFDHIVNAVGSKSVRIIADLLDQTGIPYSVIGDSVQPGQIMDAIHQAYLAVMNNVL